MSQCDILEGEIFRGNQIKMRLKWVLTQHDWCPQEKGEIQTQRSAYKEDGYLQAKESGLEHSLLSHPSEGTNPEGTLIMDL